MRLKLQQIGHSVGVILPKEELTQRGLAVGDTIELELLDDPFWDALKKHSKKQRRAVDKKVALSDDDFKEWDKL
jgi:antitoxin component of MazEF toxin-antitoxin module